MKMTIALYALGLAGAAFVLQWLEYKYVMRVLSTEWFIVIVAIGFASLGAWLARQFAPSRPQTEFSAPNAKAIAALGLTPRECEVLDLLTEGQSNKEIARSLKLTPNTVKTHVTNLYRKLDVNKRTQAVRRAQLLRLSAKPLA